MELINAIRAHDETTAMELIASNKVDFGATDDRNSTALEWACIEEIVGVAMALLATRESKPEHRDEYDGTALTHACRSTKSEMVEVALALIATGKIDLSHVGHTERCTVLMESCFHGNSEVALALIATGESNPSVVQEATGYTALIAACENGMSDVALALIESGLSNPEHVDMKGNTAFSIASMQEMDDVVMKLTEIGADKSTETT